MIIINHRLGDRLVVTATDSALSSFDGDSEGTIVWEECSDQTEYNTNGYRLTLKHTKVIVR